MRGGRSEDVCLGSRYTCWPFIDISNKSSTSCELSHEDSVVTRFLTRCTHFAGRNHLVAARENQAEISFAGILPRTGGRRWCTCRSHLKSLPSLAKYWSNYCKMAPYTPKLSLLARYATCRAGLAMSPTSAPRVRTLILISYGLTAVGPHID